MIQYIELTSKGPDDVLERTWDCCPNVDIKALKKHGMDRVHKFGKCHGCLILEDGKEIAGWIGPELAAQG